MIQSGRPWPLRLCTVKNIDSFDDVNIFEIGRVAKDSERTGCAMNARLSVACLRGKTAVTGTSRKRKRNDRLWRRSIKTRPLV